MGLKQLLIDSGDNFRQRLLTPDYTRPDGVNTAPLITKNLPGVEENPNSKAKDVINALTDGFLPGGGILAGERAFTDTKRITKFLLTGEGINFGIKDAALQRSNPRTIISPTNRTRLPLNLIAQIPANIGGLHFRRDGLLDTDIESGFNYDSNRYDPIATATTAGQGLLSTLASATVGKKYETEMKTLAFQDLEDVADGLFSLYENHKINISEDNVLKEYPGGAGSFFGIGNTQITKYNDYITPRALNVVQSGDTFARIFDPKTQKFPGNPVTPERERIRNTVTKYQFGDPDKKLVNSEIDEASGYVFTVPDRGLTTDKLNEYWIHNQDPSYIARNSFDFTTEFAENLKDYIKFRIALIDTTNPLRDEVLMFRAHLENINDNFSGNWNSFKYNGRAENFYTYNGFDREVGFSFKIGAQSKQELKPLWKKLNYLASSTAPQYVNRRMRGRFARLTIGDWCYELPGFFPSIQLNWTTSFPWNLDEAPNHFSDQYETSQHPMVLNVNCNFKPIHDFTPENEYDRPFIIRIPPTPRPVPAIDESSAGFNQEAVLASNNIEETTPTSNAPELRAATTTNPAALTAVSLTDPDAYQALEDQAMGL